VLKSGTLPLPLPPPLTTTIINCLFVIVRFHQAS
jgi:hypothetical protein